MQFYLLVSLLFCTVAVTADEVRGEAAASGGAAEHQAKTDEKTWSYSMAFSQPDQGPLLTIGPVVAVYEGEDYNGNASGSFSVFGSGTAKSKSGSLEVISAGGKVTVTFRGKAFTVSDKGKQLTVGKDEKAYELSDKTKTTVRFASDGTAKVVQEPLAAGKDEKGGAPAGK